MGYPDSNSGEHCSNYQRIPLVVGNLVPCTTTGTVVQNPGVFFTVSSMQQTQEKPRTFVAVIVRNPGGKFLFLHFVKKPTLRWRFAGGKQDAGEMLIVTAARELREEVGIEPLNLYLHSTHTERIDEGLWRGFYFVCDQYTGTPAVQEPSKHDAVEFRASPSLSSCNAPAAEMSIVRSLSVSY